MKAEEFLNILQIKGRYSFTTEEAEKALGINRIATLNALYRLNKNKLIISPVNGFYLILLPQYQTLGCLPADMFIDNLMKYFNLPYYVGFLSAAELYGAAHQKPQQFQVVTTENRRSIHCGRIFIRFIANKNTRSMPIKLLNTYTGTIRVATPEMIAADIISIPTYAAGLDNSATVLLELAEQIDADKLAELTKIHPKIAWIQKLGYLFEYLGFQKLADTLEQSLKDKKFYWTKLVPSASLPIKEKNKKWKLIINTTIEPDDV